MIIKNTFLVLLTLLLISGCASFEKKELARVDQLPDLSQYQNKPTAFIDLHFYASKPNVKVREVAQKATQLQPVIQEVFDQSQAFRSTSFDKNLQNDSDYTIQIDVYNHGNEGAAFISGFLTGYTLGLIPGAATDNYTVVMKTLDKDGKLVGEHENKDSVQTWVGVWFIPAMGNSPEKALNNTISNQVRTGLKEMIENQKIEYSQRIRKTTQELSLALNN